MKDYQEGFRQSEHFVLRQVAVLVLVVQIEEPLDILHEIVEHHAVQAGDQVLQKGY